MAHKNKRARKTFDDLLKEQHWNLSPHREIVIPAAENPLWSAAKAIAICAYPQSKRLSYGGKAHKYADALIAYIFRVAQWTGYRDRLPKEVALMRIEKMWARLEAGNFNLLRSMRIRDLISSALTIKAQNDAADRGDLSTFTLEYSPDLNQVTINIPIKQVADQVVLSGATPSKGHASLRAAIRRHSVALKEFCGPSPRIEGTDEELFYQNTITRFVKPVLRTAHIQQIVWEAASKYAAEATQRRLPIDQILMRKVEWADNLAIRTAQNAPYAIFGMQQLGISTCSCELIHIGNPLQDS